MCWNSAPNLDAIELIRGRVIAIQIFDLMTLNMCYVMRSALIYFSPSLTFDNLSVPELYCLFDADTLCHVVTLTFDNLRP